MDGPTASASSEGIGCDVWVLAQVCCIQYLHSHACVQASNSTNILLPEAVAIIRLLEELRGCGHLDQLM